MAALRSRYSLLLLPGALLLLLLFTGPASADPLDNWHWRNPTPTGQRLLNIAYGNNLFVAVGEGATILTSSNGRTWTDRNTGNDSGAKLSGIAYGNGLFVAVGEDVFTSRDGIIWTASASGLGLISVAYGDGVFMAVGNRGADGGVVAVSSDGVSWSVSPVDFGLFSHTSIRYLNGRFMVCAENGIRVYDGAGWSAGVLQTFFRDAAYGNGRYVAVGTGQTAVSTDGLSWTPLQFPENVELLSIAYGNGTFVTFGKTFVGQQAAFFAATSDDGITWSMHVSEALEGRPYSIRYSDGVDIINAAYGNGVFVAAGGNSLSMSADGAAWTGSTAGLVFSARDGAYGKGLFVLVGTDGRGGSIITSPDGASWTPRLSGFASSLSAVACGATMFVAAAANGNSLVSTDGVVWETFVAGLPPVRKMAFGKNLFVAATEGGIFSSTDGARWMLRSDFPGTGVAFGGGWFLVVGGPLYEARASSDGIQWDSVTIPVNIGSHHRFTHVAYGNGTFFAIGNGPSAARFSVGREGVAFAEGGASLMGEPQSAVAFGDGVFVVTPSGSSPYAVTISTPGGDRRKFPVPYRVNETVFQFDVAVYGAGMFVLASSTGYNGCGSIVQSDAVTPGDGSPASGGSNSAGASGSGGGGCFIATAAFGGESAWQVRVFKQFRDNYLVTNRTGRALIDRYYRASPRMVAALSEHPAWQAPLQGVLTLAATAMLHPVVTAGLFVLGVACVVIIVRRRSRNGQAGEGRAYTVPIRRTLLVPAVLLLPLFLPGGAFADPLDAWHWRNPLPQGNPLRARFLNGNFVAVGGCGTITTSKDGRQWTARDSGTKANLASAAFGNGVYVAVGAGGTLLMSNDLATWLPRASGTASDITDVAFGDGIFVAVTRAASTFGSSSSVLVSPDGVTWSAHVLPAYMSLTRLCYGNGVFAGIGGDELFWSADGIAWEVGWSTSADGGFMDIAFGDGVFAAVGRWVGNFRMIFLSTDGINWKANPWIPGSLESVGFGSGMFVAGGITDVGSTPPRCAVTFAADGSGVQTYDTGFPYATFASVAFGNNVFVATSDGAIFASGDAQAWSMQTRGTTDAVSGVTPGNGRLVAVTGRQGVLTSPNGIDWRRETLPETDTQFYPYSVAYGKGKFVAAGYHFLFTSPDGSAWTGAPFELGAPLTSVAFVNGLFLALGGQKAIVVSDNGTDWRLVTPLSGLAAATDYLTGAAFGNGKFVAVGSLGTVMTSPDGMAWSLTTVGSATLNAVAFGSGVFVAAGLREDETRARQGILLTSADGVTWSERTFPGLTGFNTVIYTAGFFVAAGYDGVVFTSANGKDWSARPAITSTTLSASCFANGTVILTGSGGTIIQSDPVTQPSSDPAGSAGAGGGGGGGGCFIATAAFGDESAWQVRAFKQFRDNYLVTNRTGRALVELYYRVSPRMADAVSRHPASQGPVRCVLTLAAYAVIHPAFTASFFVLGAACVVVIVRRPRLLAGRCRYHP